LLSLRLHTLCISAGYYRIKFNGKPSESQRRFLSRRVDAEISPTSNGAAMRYASRLLFLLPAFVLSIPLFAQNARVSGEVVDPQHASVKGAKVALTRISTQVNEVTTTDGNGDFILPPVDPGTYEIKAQSPGFETTVVTGITLEVGESKVFTLALKVGAVQQSVQVSDVPPELTTDRADRGLTIEPAFVESIPLNIRNPLQIISDGVGVTKGDDGLSGQNYSSESRSNTFRINGAKG